MILSPSPSRFNRATLKTGSGLGARLRPTIKFTINVEEGGFLDMKVTRKEDGILYTVNRRTRTGSCTLGLTI